MQMRTPSTNTGSRNLSCFLRWCSDNVNDWQMLCVTPSNGIGCTQLPYTIRRNQCTKTRLQTMTLGSGVAICGISCIQLIAASDELDSTAGNMIESSKCKVTRDSIYAPSACLFEAVYPSLNPLPIKPPIINLVVPATRFTTKALLVQTPPITLGIIHCYFRPRLDAFTHHYDVLRPEPDELLKLCIRFATVVCKPGKVTLLALPDLISCSAHLTIHNVLFFDIFGDQADKLSNRSAPFERYQGLKAVVATVGCAEDLDCDW
ncbi:hypothetical protein HG531_009196 [Fusarium graminearum]|nr:hypothetical protein HG531_009196 [Fusarium graminearum]